MNILTIPLRCVRRKWPRTLVLLGIFTLGVASISALYLVSAAVSEGFEKKLSAFGANIVISPKRETLTVSYGGIPLGDMLLDEGHMPLPQVLPAIRGIPLAERLAVVAPKLVGLTRLDGKALPVVGVDWAQELDLKQFWTVQGNFPAEAAQREGMALPFAAPAHAGAGDHPPSASGSDHSGGSAPDAAHAPQAAPTAEETRPSAGELVMGSTLAARLGLAPGARLHLDGQSFTLAGVLDPTGSDDDNVLFMGLPLAQKLLRTGDSASFVEVAALCSGCPIEDIVAELTSALPGQDVKALRQVVAQRMYAVDFARNLALLVGLVIVCTACAMLVMSMLAAVTERRREIGILRAVGFSRAGIFWIFAFEALATGLMAGALGYAAGYFAGRAVLTTLALEAASFPPFNVAEFAVCVGVSAVLAVLAATFPAWKAGRVDPATALASL